MERERSGIFSWCGVFANKTSWVKFCDKIPSLVLYWEKKKKEMSITFDSL